MGAKHTESLVMKIFEYIELYKFIYQKQDGIQLQKNWSEMVNNKTEIQNTINFHEESINSIIYNSMISITAHTLVVQRIIFFLKLKYPLFTAEFYTVYS